MSLLLPLSVSKTLNPEIFLGNTIKISHRNLHLNIGSLSIFRSPLFTSLSNARPKTSFSPRRPFGSRIKSLFTGIIEEMGEIKQVGFNQNGGFEMVISAKTVLSDVKLGDSIAVNGVCLTVTEFDLGNCDFSVGLSPETLRKTSLIELVQGSVVNLERAIQPSSRMGGHFVQGHVDGTGEIVSFRREKDSLWVKVKTSPNLLKFVVPKGFIAVDGTSLTVVNVYDDENCFDFMLVDYTQQKVVIPMKKVGMKVNLEVDILGKYVERLLKAGFAGSEEFS